MKKIRFLKYLNISLVYYLIMICAWYLIIDHRAMNLKRMNTLNNYASYPIQFLQSGERDEVSVNRLKRSISYYLIFYQVFPKEGRAQNILGYCYYLLGKNEQAVKHLKKAIALNPEHFWFFYNLGIVYYDMGQSDLARENFKTALGKKPDAPRQFDHLVPLNKIPGDTAKTIDQFKKVMEINAHRLALRAYAASLRSNDPAKQGETNPAVGPFVLHPWTYLVPMGRESFISTRTLP